MERLSAILAVEHWIPLEMGDTHPVEGISLNPIGIALAVVRGDADLGLKSRAADLALAWAIRRTKAMAQLAAYGLTSPPRPA